MNWIHYLISCCDDRFLMRIAASCSYSSPSESSKWEMRIKCSTIRKAISRFGKLNIISVIAANASDPDNRIIMIILLLLIEWN